MIEWQHCILKHMNVAFDVLCVRFIAWYLILYNIIADEINCNRRTNISTWTPVFGYKEHLLNSHCWKGVSLVTWYIIFKNCASHFFVIQWLNFAPELSSKAGISFQQESIVGTPWKLCIAAHHVNVEWGGFFQCKFVSVLFQDRC